MIRLSDHFRYYSARLRTRPPPQMRRQTLRYRSSRKAVVAGEMEKRGEEGLACEHEEEEASTGDLLEGARGAGMRRACQRRCAGEKVRGEGERHNVIKANNPESSHPSFDSTPKSVLRSLSSRNMSRTPCTVALRRDAVTWPQDDTSPAACCDDKSTTKALPDV